jgi:hypothetical protein
MVGTVKEASNPLAAFLMDLGRNPWGTYNQDEPCIHCGASLRPPAARPLWRKTSSATALALERLQTAVSRPHATWIHMVFQKQQH